jgi:hypothetical protein
MADLINVQRYIFTPDWTLSRYYINDTLSGFGVEDECRLQKVDGETAVPYGRYELGFRQSPKFSGTFYYHDTLNKLITVAEYNTLADKAGWHTHDLIWILNIPNFQYVLLHWGNTDLDTDGCYIVGNKIGIVKGREGVLESRPNYQKLYPKVYPLIRNGRSIHYYFQG